MENVLNSPSVPLVVRVKRRADEDSLDVLRLRPLRTKIARGADGSAFELQNLKFLRAGTILETVRDVFFTKRSLHEKLKQHLVGESCFTNGGSYIWCI